MTGLRYVPDIPSEAANPVSNEGKVERYINSRIKRYNESQGDLTGYDCPICRNKGNVMVLRDGIEQSIPCKCLAVRRSLKAISDSGLDILMQRETFDTYNATAPWQAEIIGKAEGYASNPVGWFFIGGGTGVGKTHICTAIAGYLLQHGHGVQYMRWRTDSTKIKTSITDKTEYDRLLTPFKTSEVLYIDDFMKGKISEADVNLAFDLLDTRYIQQKPTIISTELSLPEIRDIDGAVCGRIEEASRVKIYVPYDVNKDFRRKGV